MPYEDKYISVYRSERFLMYNAAIIKEYESSSPEQFEWYLEPAGDGYFFFRWNPDRSKYLCPANQSIVQSTGLFVLPYKSPTAPAFKWGGHLVENQSRSGRAIRLKPIPTLRVIVNFMISCWRNLINTSGGYSSNQQWIRTFA